MNGRFRIAAAFSVALFAACSSAPPSEPDHSQVGPMQDKPATEAGAEAPDDDDDGELVGGAGSSGDGGAEASIIGVVPGFSEAIGSGTKPALVTGRIYDDLAKNVDTRMDDLKALGVRVIRMEIESATPATAYAKIIDAAKKRGIEVLGLVTQNTIPGSPDPMAGTRAEFDAVFVPKVIAAIDATTTALPQLAYVEVWNEPDVYSFTPMFSYSPSSGCSAAEGAFRYALLATRVFETMNERRIAGTKTPKLAAFSFSRHDDTCLRRAVIDAQPITSHRLYYRPNKGLTDGLPADIVAIHGYGNGGKLPQENGYTYAGGTFADGVAEFLSAKFADGRPMLGDLPVWYTEVGVCRKSGFTPQQQADAVGFVMRSLRAHPRITASFIYVYRDDEAPNGGERCGLRANAAGGYAAHPAYATYKTEAQVK